jgi:dTDP-4-amino-4,6-dideoxygalactose transaminase
MLFLQKMWKFLKVRKKPISEKLSEEVLTLPMYPTLHKEEMDYIAKSISEFKGT